LNIAPKPPFLVRLGRGLIFGSARLKTLRSNSLSKIKGLDFVLEDEGLF
jgi:hypothetical protein